MPKPSLRPMSRGGSHAWEKEDLASQSGPLQLLEAIATRDMSRSQGLLMAKVDVNAVQDRYGRSALHLAALQGVVGLCRMLVSHGADTDTQDGAGNTALHVAVMNWQNLMIRILVEAQACTNILNRGNETPLMLAVNAGNMQAMQLLLEFHAQVDIDPENLAGGAGSVLLRAVQRQVLCELVELVVAAKAILDAQDEDQNSPLQLAIQLGDTRVARLLLASRADVESCNRYGRSAAHVAAAAGSVRAVRMLMDYRADLNKKDSQDQVPLQLANSATQKALRELGAYFPSRPCSPEGTPMLVEGAEWALGPKGGGIYPAGRFKIEEIKDIAKRPSSRQLNAQRSLPSLHGKQTLPQLGRKASDSNLKLAWNLDSPKKARRLG
ncbi:unnamed protein product, partial [Effrenium voratum]